MQTVTLNAEKMRLFDLAKATATGEEIFIKNAGVTLQLVSRAVKSCKRQFGSAKGLIAMAADFDEPYVWLGAQAI